MTGQRFSDFMSLAIALPIGIPHGVVLRGFDISNFAAEGIY
jgi:hypothetical protein